MLRGKSVLFSLALLMFLVATRWPLAPSSLYYFDSSNFALAMEKFDPSLHQPQPPGYPLFVALARIIHFWVDAPERVFLIAGLLAAFGAVLLIQVLAADLFGRAAGYLAAALLAAHPVLWFGGLTNQVRTFLALCTLAVAVLAWRAITLSERPAWYYAAWASLGVAAGFRPELVVVLLPLLLWTWHRTGGTVRRLAAGVGLLALAALPWLSVVIWVVRGPGRLIDVLSDYATVQFEPSSALFGAGPAAAYQMFATAVVWYLLGAVVWLWAVPRLMRRPRTPGWSEKALFLALGAVPPFLFSAIVHIGDPDQALAGISILCVAGGGVLAALVERFGERRVWAACAAVAAGQALLFFVPPGRLARASSYRAVAAVDRMNSGALSAIRALRSDGPITIVHYGSLVAWRHLAYYFPDDYVVVLPGTPARPTPREASYVCYRHQPLHVGSGAAGLIRHGSRKVVCLLASNSTAADLPGSKPFGPVYYYDRSPGTSLAIGPYKLAPAAP